MWGEIPLGGVGNFEYIGLERKYILLDSHILKANMFLNKQNKMK